MLRSTVVGLGMWVLGAGVACSDAQETPGRPSPISQIGAEKLTDAGSVLVTTPSSSGTETPVGSGTTHEPSSETGASEPAVTASSCPGVSPPTGSESEPPNEASPSDASPDGVYWVLVRSEDPNEPFAQEWEYDDAGRLVRARLVGQRRAPDPDHQFGVTVTLTYEGNLITRLVDRDPTDLIDVKYEYVVNNGRLVAYSEGDAGEVTGRRNFAYDAQGRLIGGCSSEGNETTWTVERQANGIPTRLLENDELRCSYEWRHQWLSTTCYYDGEVTGVYSATDGRLTSATLREQDFAYTYDSAGRLASERTLTNRGEEALQTFTYSAEGQLLRSVSTYITQSRTYDEQGLLREIRYSNNDEPFAIRFDYQRISPDEVVETETNEVYSVVRTYRRLTTKPLREPQLPDFYTEVGAVLPSVHVAATNYDLVE